MPLTFPDLIAPISPTSFLAEHWEKIPLVATGTIRRPETLFELEQLGSILERCNLLDRTLLFLVPAAGRPGGTKARGRDLPLDTIERALATGHSLRIEAMQDLCAPVQRLAVALTQFFDARCHANLYVTPARHQGFPIHVDAHDVVVTQLEGTKTWDVYEPPIRLPTLALDRPEPMRSQIAPSYEDEELTLFRRILLRPGDVLYVPRGFPHRAVARDATSVHLTFGLHPLTWVDLLKATIETAAADDSTLREGLPPRFTWNERVREGILAQIDERLRLLMASHAALRALEQLAVETLSSQVPAREETSDPPRSVLETTPLTHRIGLRPWITRSPDKVALRFGSKKLELPEDTLPLLEYVRDNPRFNPSDLPDAWDLESRVLLCRRLLEEGLLTHGDADV